MVGCSGDNTVSCTALKPAASRVARLVALLVVLSVLVVFALWFRAFCPAAASRILQPVFTTTEQVTTYLDGIPQYQQFTSAIAPVLNPALELIRPIADTVRSLISNFYDAAMMTLLETVAPYLDIIINSWQLDPLLDTILSRYDCTCQSICI